MRMGIVLSLGMLCGWLAARHGIGIPDKEHPVLAASAAALLRCHSTPHRTSLRFVQRQDAPKKAASPRSPQAQIADELAVEFVDTPLQEALAALKEQLNVPLWLDEAALKAAKVGLTRPVSLKADAARLDWILDRLLLPLELDWIVERNIVRVTSKTVAAKHLEARVYDVLDLLQSGFDQESLQDALELCLEPETWAAEKGPGRTHIHQGLLIVWQTQRVQAEVEQLLEELEVALDNEAEELHGQPRIMAVARSKLQRKSPARDSLRREAGYRHLPRQ